MSAGSSVQKEAEDAWLKANELSAAAGRAHYDCEGERVNAAQDKENMVGQLHPPPPSVNCNGKSKSMARAWQDHGKSSMARAWQERGNNVAITWQ